MERAVEIDLQASYSEKKLVDRLKSITSALNKVQDGDAVAKEDLGKLAQRVMKPFLRVHSSSMVKALCGCALVDLFRLMEDPFADSPRQLADALEFLIDQLDGETLSQENPEFPLHFHILELCYLQSAMLLTFRVTPEARRDAILKKLFSSLMAALKHKNIEQSVTYIHEILNAVLLEPEGDIPINILITLFQYLLPPLRENKHCFSVTRKLIHAFESRFETRILDAIYDIFEGTKYKAHFRSSDSNAQLILEVSKISPSILTYLIPKLQEILQCPVVSKRMQFTAMFGKILSLPNPSIPLHHLLESYAQRFTDADTKIRTHVVRSIPAILAVHMDTRDELIEHLMGRLSDPSDHVRIAAVSVFCDLAETHSEWVTQEQVRTVCERCLDRYESVRLAAVEQLCTLYRKNSSHDAMQCIPSALMHLFSSVPYSTTAAQALKRIELDVLGAYKTLSARAQQLVQVFHHMTHQEQELFVRVFIQHRHDVAQKLALLWDPTKKEQRVQRIKDIGQRLFMDFKSVSSHVVSTLDALVFSKNKKVPKWINEMMDPTMDHAVSLAAREEILASARLDKLNTSIVEAFVYGLSTSAFSSDIVKACLENCSNASMATAMQESALKFVSAVSESYAGLCDASLRHLDAMLRAKTDTHNAVVLRIMSTCSMQSKSKFTTRLSKYLHDLLFDGDAACAAPAVRVLSQVCPEGEHILKEEIGTLLREIDTEDANIATRLSVLGEYVESALYLLQPHVDAFLSFLVNDAFVSDNEETRRLSLYACTQYVIAKKRDASKASDVIDALLKTALDVLYSDHSSESLLEEAVSTVLQLATVKEYESILDARAFLSLAYIAHSPHDAVRLFLIQQITALIKSSSIPFHFTSILCLSAMDSSNSIQQTATRSLGQIIARRRAENRALLTYMDGGSLQLHRFPEYYLCHVCFLVSHHPGFDGSLEACYRFKLCIDLFLTAIFSKEQEHNVSLLSLLISQLREYTDSDGTQESTEKLYLASEVAMAVLKKMYQDQTWADTALGHALALPSRFFLRRADGARDSTRYLDTSFDPSWRPTKKTKKRSTKKARPASKKAKAINDENKASNTRSVQEWNSMFDEDSTESNKKPNFAFSSEEDPILSPIPTRRSKRTRKARLASD